MKRAIAGLLLFAACATAPAPLVSPSWSAVPPGVLDALCKRLQMDAIGASGTLTVVSTTQPIATDAQVGYLFGLARKKAKPELLNAAVAEANRPLPLQATDGECSWNLVDAKAQKRYDEMVVELSAPFANPAFPGEACLFARVSLDTQQEWYLISLGQRAGAWGVKYVNAMSR
jgi:hypothetical protein